VTKYLVVVCKDAANPDTGDKFAVVTPEAFDAHFGRGEQLVAVTMRDTDSEARQVANDMAAVAAAIKEG
jgi:hypothetical protein